jgi:hypothetical protein
VVAVVRIPTNETQDAAPHYEADPPYVVHAANWKSARGPGAVIGTFDASIPAFSLSLRCALKRDQRGDPYVDLPRVRVETPNGAVHLKRLARWNSAQAERQFQAAAMRAVRKLIANTEAGR